MKDPNRMNFINNSNNRDNHGMPPEATKQDRLRAIEVTKVNDSNDFDRLFEEAVKRQRETKELFEKEKNKTEPVGNKPPSDDAFADLDEEFGF